LAIVDAPPNSLVGSTTNLNVKITKGEGVGHVLWLAVLWGVEGCVGALKWGLERVTSNSIIHMDLHKPNNKLVNA
jgi:hypothetical protein